jgi:hypothetical protein
MSDKFYCQSAIEGWKDDKCDIQCDHCHKYYAPLESHVDPVEEIAEQAFKDRWEQWQYDYKGFKGWIEREFKAGVDIGWEACKKFYNIKD